MNIMTKLKKKNTTKLKKLNKNYDQNNIEVKLYYNLAKVYNDVGKIRKKLIYNLLMFCFSN